MQERLRLDSKLLQKLSGNSRCVATKFLQGWLGLSFFSLMSDSMVVYIVEFKGESVR